jgi:hypothetical protein
MIRQWVRLILLFALLLLVFSGTAVTGISQNTGEARWIHAQINRWRLGLENVGPLAYNETLEAMAIAQAEYVLSQPRFPANVHAGRSGEGPRTRATWSPYNWPTYGASEQIIVGEIAWLGTREDAMSFWHRSDIHRTAATNPRYREIGVAALPGGRGSMFVVVFGARPNVLPALADPQTNTLYLTNETYDRGVGDWIRNANQIRLFDESGRPLTDGWIPWQAKIPIPENAGNSLYVLYSDGDDEVVDSVSILARDVPLPEYFDAWQQASVAAEPTQTLPTATPTPMPVPRIRIVYSDRGFTLYNTVPSPANVSTLEIVSGEAVYRVSDFNAGFIRGSLSALPQWNCLHVTRIGARAGALPIECRYASTTTLQAHQLFWLSGDFQVRRRGGAVVAECRQSDGMCEFDLP